MTDIISMLAQAQNKAQNENNSRQQNDSVASFFNSINIQSTNNSTLPIQIKQNTLESIERNVIPNQDTQNNNASHNDLQTANSPLAMFLNSNNFNTVRTVQETNSSLGSASKVQNPNTPQAFNAIRQSQQQQQQKMPKKNNNLSSNGTASGAKETTKLITPNMLVQQSNINNNTNNNNNINIKSDKKQQPEPLTKNQMIQALKYLIENDDDFTKKVHDAYLKSLKN
jgi:hypothetical protein